MAQQQGSCGVVGVTDEQQCPVHSHTEPRMHQERQSTQTSPGVSITKLMTANLGRGTTSTHNYSGESILYLVKSFCYSISGTVTY